MKAKIGTKKTINCSVSKNNKIPASVNDQTEINSSVNCDCNINSNVVERGPQGVPGPQGEQGPQGPPGEDGQSPEITVEVLSQEGYDITYRMTFSTGGYFDFTVSNGTGSMKWITISENDWVLQEDGKYKYTYSGSYSVVGVYKGSVSNRNFVDCNINVQNGITYISSFDAFDGYALAASVENAFVESTYIHTQAIASDTWVINHNLNTYPTVDIVDSAGTKIGANEIVWNNSNTITVTFLAGFSGKAYLNYTR